MEQISQFSDMQTSPVGGTALCVTPAYLLLSALVSVLRLGTPLAPLLSTNRYPGQGQLCLIALAGVIGSGVDTRSGRSQ